MKAIQKIKIGTRGSPLALVQAEMVRAELARVRPDIATEIIVIRTSGDWSPADGEVRLEEAAGGKGQFAKEIEAALLAGEIDCGVHSMKDMETRLPDGLEISHMLPREDSRDALLSRDGYTLKTLPAGSVVGTASVRREAFLRRLRPDLTYVPLRGNVQTRIDKMKAGQVDATLLALAGLRRLGLEKEASEILPPETLLPSAGQGAVGIERRKNNLAISAIFDQISCIKTVICISSERGHLEALNGSCRAPIGAQAWLENGILKTRVQVASLDGKGLWEEAGERPVKDAAEAAQFGRELGLKLKSRVPKGVL